MNGPLTIVEKCEKNNWFEVATYETAVAAAETTNSQGNYWYYASEY